jgi:DNA-binding NarL/FixJ family response regulator
MSIRIILADDHELMRKGLRTLLERQQDLEIVGEAGDGRETMKLAKEQNPDVIIMDISMPDMNGVDATEQIMKEAPGVKIIALSMHPDRQFVERMLQAGARGYLVKDCSVEEMLTGIRAVAGGKIFLSPKISEEVIKEYVRSLPKTSVALTAREREVLQLIAEGNSTKKIADKLNISIKTVETHRKQIMDKLDIHSVAELTKYAIREGITSLEN